MLKREAQASIQSVSRADTQQLLMLVNPQGTSEKGRQDKGGDRDIEADGDGSKHTKATFIYKNPSRYPSSENTHNAGLAAGNRCSSANSDQQCTVRVRNSRSDSSALSASHRVSLDYGVGVGYDEVISQTKPNTAISSRQLSPRECLAEKKSNRDYSLKHPPQPQFRDNTLLSDHDAPLPGQADLYHELDETSDDEIFVRRAGMIVRGSEGEKEKRRDRDREGDSSYGGSIASTSDDKAKIKASQRTLTTIGSRLRLQIASRPIDISGSSRRSSQTSFAAQPLGGANSSEAQAHDRAGNHSLGGTNRHAHGDNTPGAGSSGTGGSESRFSDSGERERELAFQRPTSSARRFILGISSKMSSAVQNRSGAGSTVGSHLPPNSNADCSEEWVTSVPPEALLTALRMSMEENSSSLAMVI